ncbi:unnamed protein product, partial [Rotaria sordida]
VTGKFISFFFFSIKIFFIKNILYGYGNGLPPNYQKQVAAAQKGTDAIKVVNASRTYTIGTIANVLYIASRSTVDWAYDGLDIPYSATIELPPTQ